MNAPHRVERAAMPGIAAKWNCVLLTAFLAGLAPTAQAALQVEVRGIEGPAAENVRHFVNPPWFSDNTVATHRSRQQFILESQRQAELAMRPYGYYGSVSRGELQQLADGDWQLVVEVQPGPPMLVGRLQVNITGPGADLPALGEWRKDWPLQEGSRLDQTVWAAQKQDAMEIAAAEGYLRAAWTAHRLELDLDRHRADLVLELNTGPRAQLGEVRFEQDLVDDAVLSPLARFHPGDPYRSFLVEQFRLDLWRTGYFSEVEVEERPQLDAQPPRVDLEVKAEPRKRDTHQGTVGYGTDTAFRMQYRWDRHLLSSRGDSFNAGVGWKEQDEQVRLFGEYRLPRSTSTPQYWAVSSLLNKETSSLRITDNDGELISLASGRVDNGSVRFSRVRLWPVPNSRERVAESLYVEHLRETNDLTERDIGDGPIIDDVTGLLQQTSRSLSIGIDYDWPVINGRGFHTSGHHEHAWLFSANEAWGSELDFTQLFLSSRWDVLLGESTKLSARAEAGWSDAEVVDVEVDLGGEDYLFSVTTLPYRYRFQAGGSHSVRGYGFQELSSNGIGSNHLLTGSLELEYNFHGDWSGAVFVDAGNAFNDWSDPDLRLGAGVGLRWYTLAGAIRLDVAQGLDLPGKPWEVYITIGTPLL